MTKETLPTQEIIEARIGEEGVRELEEVARCLAMKEKISLRIKDQTLVEPALERIKRQIAQWEQEAGRKDPINFVVVDFREKGSKAWLEQLTKLLGDVKIYHDTRMIDQGREEDNLRAHAHRGKDRLILINPLADGDKDAYEGFHKINLYVKYGMSTLTILPDKPRRLPPLISELVGEHSDRSYFLDYDPLKRD